MATHAIALGADIQAAITAGTAGDTYTFAAGTYYAQSWTPKNGDTYIGDPAGTVLSGGWKVSSWTQQSGNWYYATQGVGDRFTATNFPNPLGAAARITGSITTTTLTVASTQAGAVANSSMVYGNGLADFTRITAGSGSSWTITPSQTVGAGTSMIVVPHLGYNLGLGDSNFMWSERVFVDGSPLTRIKCAATPADPGVGNFYYDLANNRLHINIGGSPSGKLIEYTATASILDTTASINNVTLSNFTVEKYGYYMRGAPFTFWGSGPQTGWKFYNMTFRYNKTYGLNYGAQTYPNTSTLQIKGGKFNDNGVAGISASCSSGSIDGVEFARNNETRSFDDSANGDAGGFKVYEAINLTVTNCIAHHNGGQGLWFDIDCSDCVVANNTVYNNYGPGIMYEISWGTTKIINNFIYGGVTPDWAMGIYISNGQDVECYGNTIYVPAGHTSYAGGIQVQNNARGSSSTSPNAAVLYEARNCKIHHNTIYFADDSGAKDGYLVFQAISGGSTMYKDFNTYYVPSTTGTHWNWSTDVPVRTDYTWANYQAAGFEPNSTRIVGVPPTPPANTVGSAQGAKFAGQVTLVALDISIVTTGGTAVAALSAGHRTAGGWIKNPETATANLGINETGTATGTSSSGATTFIAPGETYYLQPTGGAVSVISSVSSHVFSGMGWT